VKQPLRPYLWMLASSFAFSWMGTLTQLAGHGCSWQWTAIVRCVLPLLLVAGWAWLAGVRLVFWGTPTLWMRSLAGSCSLVGTFYALHRLPLTEVYTVANMFPIWVALLSWPMLGRAPARSVWLCVASGVAGVVLILQPRFVAGDYTVLVVVAVSLFTALALMGLHHLKAIDPRAIVVHFSATALAFAVVAALVFPTVPAAEPFAARHAALLFGVGVCATIGQYFLTLAFTSGEPARLSVVSLTQIVLVFILDLVVFGHRPQVEQLLGIPLVLGPATWLMVRQARRVPREPEYLDTPVCAAEAKVRFTEAGQSTWAAEAEERERAR
jgi:drug/metabolite transporter (DMT)-like permease